MRRTLEELSFKNIDQDGFTAWVKVYKGFLLFIAKVPGKKKYLASVTVGEVEVSIPYSVDDYWLCEFDSQNNENV